MATDHTPRGPAIPSGPPKNAGRVNSFLAVKRVIERRGVRGLWTGFQLHLVRDVIGSGIYFGIYETTKQSLNSYYGAEKANSAGAVAIAGALCGIGAWVVVRMQPACSSLHESRSLGRLLRTWLIS